MPKRSNVISVYILFIRNKKVNFITKREGDGTTPTPNAKRDYQMKHLLASIKQ